jgi:hypothetical protein
MLDAGYSILQRIGSHFYRFQDFANLGIDDRFQFHIDIDPPWILYTTNLIDISKFRTMTEKYQAIKNIPFREICAVTFSAAFPEARQG